MSAPTDFTIIGTVLALTVAILALAGLALYVSFRLRETLRDEKGGRARAVKVAFLIGLLFLSGGVFYFFASGFNATGGQTSTQSTSTASLGTTLSTAGSSTSAASSTSVGTKSTSSTVSTSTTASGQGVSMPAPSCAGSRVTAGSTFSCYVDIFDQGSATFGGATLVSSGDFAKFTFLSCNESVNGGSATPVSCSGNGVAVGQVVPNTVVLTLTIQAPSQPGQYSASVLTLSANGLQPIAVTFTIQVTA